MKVKDITEGMWNQIGKSVASGFASGTNAQSLDLKKRQQELKNKQSQLGQIKTAVAGQKQAVGQFKPNPERSIAAEPSVSDIKDTLKPGTQYRFPNPDYPGTQIIVRDSGWYIDRLPPQLRGQIKRDSATGLYPVLQPTNIKKYNLYYNQAADAGKVKDEPAAAL